MEYLIGIILPPIIEVINRDVKNDVERFIMATVVCLLVACAVDWQAVVNTHLPTLLQTLAIIMAETNIVFNLYWKNSFLRNKLQQKIGGESEVAS